MTEGGDKEKLEAFINFCEDAIFEMQHASGLMAVDDSGGGGPTRAASYSYMNVDDEDRGKDPIRRGYQSLKDGISYSLSALSPSNIKHKINEMQQMTIPELFVAFFRMILYAFYYSGFGVAIIFKYVFGVLLSLMRGPVEEPMVQVKEEEEKMGLSRMLPALPSSEEQNTQLQTVGTDSSKDDTGQYVTCFFQSQLELLSKTL